MLLISTIHSISKKFPHKKGNYNKLHLEELGLRKVKNSITPSNLPKPEKNATRIDINIIGIWKFLLFN